MDKQVEENSGKNIREELLPDGNKGKCSKEDISAISPTQLPLPPNKASNMDPPVPAFVESLEPAEDPKDLAPADAFSSELHIAGKRRHRSSSGLGTVKREEEKELAEDKVQAPGQTQAETAGKNPGRWSREEHERFLSGKDMWICPDSA